MHAILGTRHITETSKAKTQHRKQNEQHRPHKKTNTNAAKGLHLHFFTASTITIQERFTSVDNPETIHLGRMEVANI
jgi:hypothetical protein